MAILPVAAFSYYAMVKTEDRRFAWFALAFALLALIGGIALSELVRRQQALTQHLASLASSEARFRSLVEGALYGIYRSDEEHLIFANPALVKMLGYQSEEELMRLNLAHDLYQNSAARAQLIKEVHEHPEGHTAEALWKKKDGTPLTVRVTARQLRDAEGRAFFEGIVEDFTAQRLMEEQFRHSEKLAALGRLVAGAAHEINNPLTAIMGYAELLATDPEASPQQRSFGEKIRQQARRTRAITSNLQSFSSQQLIDKKQWIDFNNVVANAMRIEDMNFGLGKISFHLQLDPMLPRILGDEYQMLEVCMHILNNSVDAVRESGGGAITTRTYSEDGMVVAEFSDSGPGMQEPSRVFDPFYTTKPVGSGAGLGLSACYGIVKEHGGTIACFNRPEGGATVVVKLPAASAAEPAADALSDL